MDRHAGGAGRPEMEWYILAGILASFHISFLAWLLAKEDSWWLGLVVLAVVPLPVVPMYPLIAILKPLAWYQPLVVFLLLSLLILGTNTKPFLLLAGGTAVFLLGGAFHGAVGATLGMAGYGVAVAMIAAVYEGYTPLFLAAGSEAGICRSPAEGDQSAIGRCRRGYR